MTDIILPISSNTKGIPVVSTLDFCEGLGINHKSLLDTIRTYLSAIESGFGQVAFETATVRNSVGAANQIVFARLTEDQALFVGTLSRNSERVVEFKSVLVRSFAEARRRALQPQLPQTFKEALVALLGQVEQNERLQAENETLRPKAQYADAVLSSETELTTTVIGKELGMSAIALHKKLHAIGVIWKQRGIWVLYSKHEAQGYAVLKTHPYTDSQGKPQTKHYLVWTEKGRLFIHSKLNPAFRTADLAYPVNQLGIA
ncbi:phage antirepressor KilAC domain-containing protein [Spirosoma validum]|uniref:Phage antirepressor KilAC domain-containing protein n=1 Tax=Spirosoma validum TaxID=2771355 RepID=A0A927B1V7_9BACT|nr:phage antirepressor KilAC domain-containing protein [Spirosoma validum]MBD2753826.1 phage antirepressor KilAC domain-containing protein [Spirosoma validum]